MNRPFIHRAAFLAVLALLASVPFARAADEEVADAQAATIDPLIARIIDDDATDRREATDELLKLGESAVEPLAKAAQVDNATIVQRCLDAMGRLLVSDNEKTAKAAQAALEKLSKSEIDVVGRKARITLGLKEVLRQREALLKEAPPAGGFPFGGIRVNGQMIAGGNHSTKVTINNGKRTIEVTAGDEKIEITDNNGKDIVVKHTRTVDGKKKSDEYKGADLEDLKKNHPEGAKLYEKHTAANNGFFGGAGGGGIQIQIRGGQVVPGAPFQFPAPGAAPFQFQPDPIPNQPAGPRTIKAELDGRKIEVSETDGKKIRVKLTKLVNGKEVSQEFKAEDLKTLKAEHPEAAEIYSQLTGKKVE